MQAKELRIGSRSTAAATQPLEKSLSALLHEDDVRLALDNDALLRVAENVAYLRRHRSMTQKRLAKRMKTSQAAVARIERGAANITLRTLENVVKALSGRLQLAISPFELNLPALPPWWELVQDGIHANEPLYCQLLVKQTGTPDRIGAGWATVADGAWSEVASLATGEAERPYIASAAAIRDLAQAG